MIKFWRVKFENPGSFQYREPLEKILQKKSKRMVLSKVKLETLLRPSTSRYPLLTVTLTRSCLVSEHPHSVATDTHRQRRRHCSAAAADPLEEQLLLVLDVISDGRIWPSIGEILNP